MIIQKILISSFLYILALFCYKNDFIQINAESSQNTKNKNLEIVYMDFMLVGELSKFTSNSNKDSASCNNWVFKRDSAFHILDNMRLVEANEAYVSCYQYECGYIGTVANENLNYEITIYPGGIITLSNDITTLNFIMEIDSQLFISICNCCEE